MDCEVPPVEDFEHLTIEGAQKFFETVAKVEGFPDEKTFRENAAEPEKGMTIDEFVKWINADQEGYLDQCYIGFFTGRRIRIASN
eukprot:CAMPEP_0117525348 /NCGR_PEP_ID=MMETSP0784-20121206/35722_1 /TAXON_ID=39447 /ORGANISM="" /LENGTH=84 /DNA_ID=CAMNT_0005321539 /DNA_START=12 /DNA_END=263 /DNA_ORIENTATION=+